MALLASFITRAVPTRRPLPWPLVRFLSVEVLENLAAASLTDEQLAFRDLARDFSKSELEPYAAEWDRTCHFPVDQLRKAASLGFGAMFCKEDLGGTGLGRVDGAVIFEELARGCTSTTAYLTIHNMVAWMIDTFGDVEQRSKWLPRLASMELLGSYCLTEPGAGSDAGSLTTTAVPTADGHYLVNGSKAFISGAGATDVYLVMCRVPSGQDGTGGGVSCLLLEKGMEGLTFGENEAKMGWKSQPTRQVFFDQVRVPVSHLIGPEGAGFKIAMQGLDGGRLSIGACSLGTGAAALDLAKAYAQERRQFGRPLSEFQALQFKLADMATDLHAGRLVLRNAASLLDQRSKQPGGGQPGGGVSAATATVACAMAKVKATDAGFKVCNEALQIHGGYGYLRDYPLERMVRDVRVHQILEGTNEVMRHIISRALLK